MGCMHWPLDRTAALPQRQHRLCWYSWTLPRAQRISLRKPCFAAFCSQKYLGPFFFSCVIRGFADALSKGVARIFFPSKCWTALFTLPTTPNRKQDAQRMQTRRAVQQNDLAIYNKFLEKVSMMGQISTESVTHISLQLRTMWYRSLYLAPRHIPKTLPMA